MQKEARHAIPDLKIGGFLRVVAPIKLVEGSRLGDWEHNIMNFWITPYAPLILV